MQATGPKPSEGVSRWVLSVSHIFHFLKYYLFVISFIIFTAKLNIGRTYN